MNLSIDTKLCELSEALAKIPENGVVVTSMAASEPLGFLQNFHTVLKGKSIKLFCANPSEAFPIFTLDELEGNLEIFPMFLTSVIRGTQGRDRVHYIPQHLSQWSKNILINHSVDVFWGSCTRPDKRGFISLGPSNVYESDIFRSAKTKILEFNDKMPVTYGGTSVHVSEVDYLIENTHPLSNFLPKNPDAVEQRIASFVSDLIEDESTIQLGIGGIPNAVAELLNDKKNLGIHTEMINDAMVTLYEKGIVNGSKKTLWPGKIVGSFAQGSQRLYDFLDQNPIVELQPAQVVNDPYRIGKNHKMVSLNTAVEIDITGQVCSESVGHHELSGVGGAFETHVGAQWSIGGKGIVALRSMTRNEKHSKIKLELTPGAKVSISRNDIDIIVTEFGVARLKGKSVADRVASLIAIAHPSQREQLSFESRKLRYV